jgi:hypothetical protein
VGVDFLTRRRLPFFLSSGCRKLDISFDYSVAAVVDGLPRTPPGLLRNASDDSEERIEMRYVLLIYGNEKAGSQQSQQEEEAVMAAYMAFGETFKSQITGGEALLPTTSATTVRVREGKTLSTDGPFAETKEQLGGYYVISCKDLDEAIQVAANIPGAREGSIEVRPVMEFE